MFESFFGLPLHPLAVHAAVVLVPLLALVSLVYALLPKLRRKVAWAAVGLAVVAPISAVVAKMSGDAFVARLGVPLDGPIGDHAGYGFNAMLASLGLGVVTLAMVGLHHRFGSRSWAAGVMTGLVVVVAVAALVFVFLAGDTGARSVWEGRWLSTS